MSKGVVVLSGGLDSTVLLYAVRANKHDPIAVSFDYGQRHRKELDAARGITSNLGVEHIIIDLRSVGEALAGSGSALLGDSDVPHGHYEDESMKKTVVPNRNMIMLSIAAGIAMSRKGEFVCYGAHGGDHAIYPDCRPEFAASLAKAVALADWTVVGLAAPFENHTKAEIVGLGAQLGVPFEKTWSCYEGGAAHCGKCGTCVERREAFVLAGAVDPTEYANGTV